VFTACDNKRSFERGSDGSTVYLDELNEAAKADARQRTVASLTRGADIFGLEVGDEVEILFNINRTPTRGPYHIRVGDELHIEFLSDSDKSRAVTVRPDGRISLPLLGPVVAAGQTPDAFARQLQDKYSGIVAGAQLTVNVSKSHSPLDDFLEVLGTGAKTRSVTEKVLPDGTLAVPLLQPIPARRRTLAEVQSEINRGFAAKGLNVYVSLVPRTLHAGSTFVLGEVGKPGRIDFSRPRTVLMAIIEAGGVSTSAAMSSVRVFYVGEDGTPHLRSINLLDVMDGLKLEQDMIVPDNSVIYVPPTELAQVGRFLDVILRDILRYNGAVLGLGYTINNNSSSSSNPFTPPTK